MTSRYQSLIMNLPKNNKNIEPIKLYITRLSVHQEIWKRIFACLYPGNTIKVNKLLMEFYQWVALYSIKHKTEGECLSATAIVIFCQNSIPKKGYYRVDLVPFFAIYLFNYPHPHTKNFKGCDTDTSLCDWCGVFLQWD